jgi:fumarate hydratase subunit alpha
MRRINVNKIKKTVEGLVIEANTRLRRDVLSALVKAARLEGNKRARAVLKILAENAAIAEKERLAVCQDTGIACVYLKIGQDARLAGGELEAAVNSGVREGYRKGYFRNSVVGPLDRKNTGDNTPAVIHTEIVKGDRVGITVVPKGFGCENKSQAKMFAPTADMDDIKRFIVGVVKEAGADACPPYVIGVGIGGTSEKAAEMSKEALLKAVPGSQRSVLSYVRRLEKELLQEINRLGIGAGGVGGKTTALAVNILTHPTHIAGLPVAVSVGCHAMRSAAKII